MGWNDQWVEEAETIEGKDSEAGAWEDRTKEKSRVVSWGRKAERQFGQGLY